MAIVINIDVMMAKRKMTAGALAEKIGITPTNLSILKNNRAKAIRIQTLDALCMALECQPADILEYKEEEGLQWRKQRFRKISKQRRPRLIQSHQHRN